MSNTDRAIIKLPDSAKMLCAHIRSAREGYYWFEFSRCRQQRTLSQNAFFHGVWLPPIARRLTELSGEDYDIGRAKSMLKREFLTRAIVNKDTGEIIGNEVLRTRDLDVQQMSEFLDEVHRFAMEFLDLDLPMAER